MLGRVCKVKVAARRAGLCLLALCSCGLAAPASSAALLAQQPVATPGVQPQADVIAPALAALRSRQPQAALDLLTKALSDQPDNAAANLLAATCALQLAEPKLAVTYAERARTLEPENWKTHTTLVTAYAMAGQTRERDAERATLRDLHTAGKVPEATQTSGFLLDIFGAGKYRVEAVEYFAPVGKFHIYFHFVIRNQAGARVWEIDAQSDDYNQASWAKAYPDQAAQGQRQFQLTGQGNGIRNDYRTFSGSPNYDWIKARVAEIVSSQAAPFPGEPPGLSNPGC